MSPVPPRTGHKNNSLGFHHPVNREQPNQAREKGGKNAPIRHVDIIDRCGHVVRAGAFSQVVNLNRVRK